MSKINLKHFFSFDMGMPFRVASLAILLMGFAETGLHGAAIVVFAVAFMFIGIKPKDEGGHFRIYHKIGLILLAISFWGVFFSSNAFYSMQSHFSSAENHVLLSIFVCFYTLGGSTLLWVLGLWKGRFKDDRELLMRKINFRFHLVAVLTVIGFFIYFIQ